MLIYKNLYQFLEKRADQLRKEVDWQSEISNLERRNDVGNFFGLSGSVPSSFCCCFCRTKESQTNYWRRAPDEEVYNKKNNQHFCIFYLLYTVNSVSVHHEEAFVLHFCASLVQQTSQSLAAG